MGSQVRSRLFAFVLVVGALILIALVWRGERSPRNNLPPRGTEVLPTAATPVPSLAVAESAFPLEAVGKEPPTQQPTEAAEASRATVHGRVIDASTKEPVSGATVWASGSEPDPSHGPVAVSDSAGCYRLVGVPHRVVKFHKGGAQVETALFELHVVADGMQPDGGGISTDARADSQYVVDLELSPLSTLAILVTGVVRLDGDPVADALVSVLGVDGLPRGGGWCDPDGRFQIELPAGPAVLFALRHMDELDHAPYGFREIDVRERMTNECDTDLAVDEGTALSVTWHCTEPTRPSSAGFRVELWLHGPKGEVAMDLLEQRLPPAGEPRRFENLPRGKYEISFAKPFSDYCVLPAMHTVLVAPGEPVELSFLYGLGADFGGQVTGLFTADGAELRLVHRTFAGIETTANISADGSFHFPQVPRGLYRLSLVVDGRDRDALDVGPEPNRDLLLHAE